MDPDELYTLRAQFWLGHYTLCLEECKAVARRPMSPSLKAEREEFIYRANIAQGQYDKVIRETAGSDKSKTIQALNLHATYEVAASLADTTKMDDIISKLKNLLYNNPSEVSTSLQLTAAHIFLRHNLTREALQCVHLGVSMEHIAICLQIYLKIDRLDLAEAQLSLLKQADEDAILTQLGSVYYNIAKGKSGASEALHVLSMLSEQYGPSIMLLNTTAVAHLVVGNYSAAEGVLLEAKEEMTATGVKDADTLINLIVCTSQMGKDSSAYVEEMKKMHQNHVFVEGLERVENAFERESLKYAVDA